MMCPDLPSKTLPGMILPNGRSFTTDLEKRERSSETKQVRACLARVRLPRALHQIHSGGNSTQKERKWVLQPLSNNSECDLLWPPPPGAWSLGLGHLHHDMLVSPRTTRAADLQGPCQVHLEQRGVCMAAEVHSWGCVKVSQSKDRPGVPRQPPVPTPQMDTSQPFPPTARPPDPPRLIPRPRAPDTAGFAVFSPLCLESSGLTSTWCLPVLLPSLLLRPAACIRFLPKFLDPQGGADRTAA